MCADSDEAQSTSKQRLLGRGLPVLAVAASWGAKRRRTEDRRWSGLPTAAAALGTAGETQDQTQRSREGV
jgi:hypothetical protein